MGYKVEVEEVVVVSYKEPCHMVVVEEEGVVEMGNMVIDVEEEAEVVADLDTGVVASKDRHQLGQNIKPPMRQIVKSFSF